MQRNVYKGFTCTTNKINADYWLKLVNQETSNPYLAGSKAERYKTEKKNTVEPPVSDHPKCED